MPKLDKQRMKRALIDLGVYKPARRVYDRLFRPDRAVEHRECMALYSQFVKSGDLCFDVGANVGHKCEAMLALGARVIAVEPQPSCQVELRAMFGGHPRFTLVPKAVASAAGTARMRIARTSLLSSLRQDWYPDCVAEIDVELTTLDALIDTFGTPRFCKIDIEGYELEALHGLTRRIEYMSLEYNSGHPDLTFACIDELSRLGDLELNYSRMEELMMASEQWLGHADFEARLREELRTQPDTYWGGDVFIHVNSPAGSN
jgi:FkbM family methyltransferase